MLPIREYSLFRNVREAEAAQAAPTDKAQATEAEKVRATEAERAVGSDVDESTIVSSTRPSTTA